MPFDNFFSSKHKSKWGAEYVVRAKCKARWPVETQYRPVDGKVRVRKEHIEEGDEEENQGCAVALAMGEHLRQRVSVGKGVYALWRDGKVMLHRLPRNTVEWQEERAKGENVGPFSFKIA